MSIDVTLPPYNVVADWQGNDATATDNYAGLQLAINDAASTWGLIDNGGGDGDTLLLPRGSIMVGQKLVLPPGVSLLGSGMASTTLVMKETFNPAHHFIDLGDSSLHYAAFGNSIRNLRLWSPKNIPANYNTYMVYSNNAQDIDAVMQSVIVDGGSNRGGVKYEVGYGGATIVRFKQLVVNARNINNFPMHVNVSGSTIVEIDGFEPVVGWVDPNDPNSGSKPGGIGLVCSGGSFKLSNFHPEQVETLVFFNMVSDNQCMAECQWFTGGGGLKNMISIYNNLNQKDKIWVNKLMRKGSWIGPTVQNGQSGGTSVYTDIMEWTKF